MSNQVYSNFEQRERYRAPTSNTTVTILADQTIPQNMETIILFEDIATANLTYTGGVNKLVFEQEGVYSINLTTEWSTDDLGHRVSQEMIRNIATVPLVLSITQESAIVGVSPAGPILTSTYVGFFNKADDIVFRCLGSSDMLQDLIKFGTILTVNKLS